MKFLLISALVCGAFIFVSAQSSDSNDTSQSELVDTIENEFKNIADSVHNAIDDLNQVIQNGTSALAGKKGRFTSGTIDTIIQSITNMGSQVSNTLVPSIEKGLSSLQEGVVKTINESIANIENLQRCANSKEGRLEIADAVQGIEKCAMDAVGQGSTLIHKGIAIIEQLASNIGKDLADTMGCVGSFMNIFKCMGTMMNGGLRGAQDISHIATKSVEIGTGIFVIPPGVVGCVAGQVNQIIRNITNMGIDVTQC